MQEPSKFCPACGARNNLSAQFCQKCGLQYTDAPPALSPEPARPPAKPLSTGAIIFLGIFGCLVFSWVSSMFQGNKTAPSTSVGFTSSPATTPSPDTARTAVNTNCDRVAGALAEVAMNTLGYDDVVGFCRDDGTVLLKFADLKRGQIIRTAALLEPLINQAMKDSRTGPAMRQAEVSKVCVTNGGILSREERCFYLH